MYKVAVIGNGYMARRHMACVERNPHAEIAMVINRERVVKHEDELFSTLKCDDRIDAIMICSPDSTHPDYVSRLLPSRKTILCEKPLARTAEEFQRILPVADNNRVLVGMNCRFRTKLQYLKEVVNGARDDVRMIRAAYYSNIEAILNGTTKSWWMDYPEGVTPFLHGGAIHLFDALRFLAGEVDEVSCTPVAAARVRALGGTEFVVAMRFASGAVADVSISGTSLSPNRFEIFLEGDGYSIDGAAVYAAEPGQETARCTPLPADDPHDLDRQLTHMIDVIEGKAPPLNSVSEAYRNFHVIKACEDSAASGRWVAVARAQT